MQYISASNNGALIFACPSRLRIIAKGNNLKNRVEGICGNYNDDPSDDITDQVTGEVVTDTENFVNSWRVLGFNDT